MKKELIRQIPFIHEIPPELEVLFLQPYYDPKDNVFKMYTQRDDKLSFIYANPVEACYWSKKIIDDKSDMYVSLIDILARRYAYEKIMNILLGLKKDVINMSVFMEKYFLLHKHYLNNKDVMISSIFKTDLECFFGNTRSMFDLVNKILMVLYKKQNRKNLPDSFRKLVTKEKEELVKKYSLPDPMILFLTKWKNFFMNVRAIRDVIYHGGVSIESVFCFNDGFAFSLNDDALPIPLFKRLNSWDVNKMKKNQMVSFLALISYVTQQMLFFLDEFSNALLRTIEPHDSITSDTRIFIRGPYMNHLVNLDFYSRNHWI